MLNKLIYLIQFILILITRQCCIPANRAIKIHTEGGVTLAISTLDYFKPPAVTSQPSNVISFTKDFKLKAVRIDYTKKDITQYVIVKVVYLLLQQFMYYTVVQTISSHTTKCWHM